MLQKTFFVFLLLVMVSNCNAQPILIPDNYELNDSSYNLNNTNNDLIPTDITGFVGPPAPNIEKINVETAMPPWLWIALILLCASMGYIIGKQKIPEKYYLSDPYSGPRKLPRGLPTIQSVIYHLIDEYKPQTVFDNSKSIIIDDIKLVYICGQIKIIFDDDFVSKKDLSQWVLAWQCNLSDGSEKFYLLESGNTIIFDKDIDNYINSVKNGPEFSGKQKIWPLS